MSKRPRTVPQTKYLGEAAGIMVRNGYNRLPVVNGDGELVGILTRGDAPGGFSGRKGGSEGFES